MAVRRVDPAAASGPAATLPWIIGAAACVAMLLTMALARLAGRPRRHNRHSVRRAAEEAARRANRIAAEADDGVRVRVAHTKESARAGTAAAGAAAATGDGRGLGLFAVGAAPLGTCLLAEPPLFTAPSAPPSALLAAWARLDEERRREVMAFSDAHAQPGGPKSIFGIMRTNCLPTADVPLQCAASTAQEKETQEEPRAEAKAASASASPPIDPKEEGEQDALLTGTGSLFLLTCRANHSCRPNAEYSWSEELGAELLYPCPPAISQEDEAEGRVPALQPNEEITIRSDRQTNAAE